MESGRFLRNVFESELYPLLKDISQDLEQKTKQFVNSIEDDGALETHISDIAGPFWSLFDHLTRSCILKSPSSELQYMMAFVACNRSEKQVDVFEQAFDCIFGDVRDRLATLSRQTNLFPYIHSMLQQSPLEKLVFWQKRFDTFSEEFQKLLKDVLFAHNGPYASTQIDALDVLLMMRPFLRTDLSFSTSTTNNMTQTVFYLLEKVTHVHRFDLIKSLNHLYPEFNNNQIDVEKIKAHLNWQESNMLDIMLDFMLNKNKRAALYVDLKRNEEGAKAISLYERCMKQLRDQLGINVSIMLFRDALMDGRLEMQELIMIGTKLTGFLKEEVEKDEEGVSAGGVLGAKMPTMDELFLKVTKYIVQEQAGEVPLEPPSLD